MVKTSKTRRKTKDSTRTFRFVLYAVILIVLLVCLRRKQASLKAGDEALALLNKAHAEEDQTEKMRLLDMLVDTYVDYPNPHYQMPRAVAFALEYKSRLIKNEAEKWRLRQEIIDRYHSLKDRLAWESVTKAMLEFMKQAGSPPAKIAYIDKIFEIYGDALTDTLSVWLLTQKAELMPDSESKIAIYDSILARFASWTPSPPEWKSCELTMRAAMRKMELVGDAAEQIRLCDMVMDAFMKYPKWIHFENVQVAVGRKAALAGDSFRPSVFWNQFIETHRNSEDGELMYIVARAGLGKGKL